MDDSIFLPLDNKQGETPKRIQLLPSGPNIKGRDGRVFVLKDAEAVAKASNEYLPNHSIDENHAVDLVAPIGGSSPAFGWFQNVTVEKDGSIWADVEWTEKGKAAVSGLEYRYISPVLFLQEEGVINLIARASLSNSPNLDIKSLNNSKQVKPAKELNMKSILAFLGLSETATEAEALAAVSAMKTSLNAAQTKGQSVDLTAYAPRADVAAMETRALAAEKQLAELNAASLKKETEAAVDQAIKDRKIAPASREQYLSLCSTKDGLENFKKAMAASPAVFGDTSQVPAGSPPGSQTSLNAEEVAMAKSMGYSEDEWKTLKGVSK
jgi:phage I-like protein